MRKGIFIALAAVVVVFTVASAGCFDNIHFLPNEVQNRGNIIAVDDDYVGSSTVLDLLLTPEKYQQELFSALDNYLPKDKPVVDVEVGLGIAMASIAKTIDDASSRTFVALSSNPYMHNLLLQTISKNKIRVDLQYKVINYDVSEGENVSVIVAKNQDASSVMNKDTSENVMVPATTVCNVIDDSLFTDKHNVTLVIEDEELIANLFQNEDELFDYVSTIIAVSSASSTELSQILNRALKAGYTPAMVGEPGVNNCRPLVFQRVE